MAVCTYPAKEAVERRVQRLHGTRAETEGQDERCLLCERLEDPEVIEDADRGASEHQHRQNLRHV
ncbi:hypothetical protein DPMN_043884 [Dreissena polymorpha]|uniref:Uncharacterized protein n=1 Tax=Dreissena polymorpha TaxID=45954 RepID=A0A9D4D3L2_DREPO|nr:hypothetical protein DPMN_043884 [Dreissena polymorpha]